MNHDALLGRLEYGLPKNALHDTDADALRRRAAAAIREQAARIEQLTKGFQAEGWILRENLKKVREEADALREQLADAETALRVWDESGSSEYWQRYAAGGGKP